MYRNFKFIFSITFYFCLFLFVLHIIVAFDEKQSRPLAFMAWCESFVAAEAP
jgi:hypothetical protein